MRPIPAAGAVAFLVALVLVPALPAAAQQGPSPWRDVEAAAIAERAPRVLAPRRFRTLALDETALRALLAAAPPESAVAARASTLELALPHPEGGFARFRVVDSPVMVPALAAKFPAIRTWMGQGVDDPAASVRFDLTPAGFRAQVLAPGGSWYIDPYQPGDRVHHIAYRRADHARSDAPVRSCAVIEGPGTKAGDAPHFAPYLAPPKVSSGATLRTYRLAVAATGEYTAFHGGTSAGGLGAIVSTINRVNGIYEREIAVRMVLVADNDRIIYTDGATDPYTNNNGGTLLGENQANLDAVIGNANYDVGHVFSTGGGGVATLASVCATGAKARGVTGQSAPVGDPFDVDYVAHEIGHQFNAPHTFNSAVASCSGGNRSAGSAYETGSGVTIMAYAGICGAENLQPNSEDHFHRHSLDRIIAFTAGGGACGVATATGNGVPTVVAPPAVTIPRLTPFALTATGSDPDGDTLTWLWEQYDLGPSTTGGVLVDDGLRPILRPLAPARDATRVFPDWRFILANANVVPATAPLPGTSSPPFYAGETLPATLRTLNFRVTARDNRAGGGGTNEAAVAIAVSGTAGPFRVAAPNTAASWAAGSTQPVAWDVAGTNLPPIGTGSVRITLSLDGGASFPVVLAASTPNDGSENVALPAGTAATSRARIRIEALGNVYFDVSDVDFAITAPSVPSIAPNGSVVSTRQGGSASAVVATVSDAQQPAGSLVVTAGGTPPELTVGAVNAGGTVTLNAAAACSLVAPTSGVRVYPVQLVVADAGGASAAASVNVEVAANRAPTVGAYPDSTVETGGAADIAPATAPADPDGNLATSSVSPSTLPGGGTLSVGAGGVVSVATAAGTVLGSYTVRVTVADGCGAVQVRQFVLQVAEPGVIFRDGFEP